MPSTFPNSFDNLPTNHVDNINENILAATVNNIASAVNAVETSLLPGGTGTVTSISPLPGGGDDTAALNAWLSTSSGVAHYFSGGLFSVLGTLVIPANTQVFGTPQTTIQKRNGSNTTLISMSAGASLYGLTIDGNKAGNTTLATSNSDILVNGDGCRIVNCHIKNSGYSAITTGGAFGYGYIADNWIEDTADRSIYLQTQNVAWTIRHNRIMRPGSDMGTGPGGVVVHGPGVGGSFANQSDACVIDGNFVDFTGVALTGTAQFLAIECYGLSPRSVVVNNRIYGPASVAGGCAMFGISIDSSHTCVVANNQIYSSLAMFALGIEVASSQGCTISANNIYGCATPGSQGLARGISMTRPNVAANASLKENAIVGNHIEACQYGIYGQEDCRGNLFEGNVLVDCVRGMWFNGGARGSESAADNSIIGNLFRVKNLGQATNLPAGATILTGATESWGLYLLWVKGYLIEGNQFGPDIANGAPLPAAPFGIKPIYLGGSQQCTINGNRGDGRRPSDGSSNAPFFIDLDVNSDDFTISNNTARNYTSGFNNIGGFTGTPVQCRYWMNDTGGLNVALRNAVGAADGFLGVNAAGLQWQGTTTRSLVTVAAI